MVPVDPAELRRLAARLDEHAGRLRHSARTLAAAAARTHWRSAAATAFGASADDLGRGLIGAAARLESAAAALRAHAATAAASAAVLARAEHDALATGRGIGRAVRGLLA